VAIQIAKDVKSFSTQIAKRFGLVVAWQSVYGDKGIVTSHPTMH
jgi:hypothetical protein